MVDPPDSATVKIIYDLANQSLPSDVLYSEGSFFVVFSGRCVMISINNSVVKKAMPKITSVLLDIRALTYDRSDNYWLEMSWLQIPYYDRQYYYHDRRPTFLEDK